MSLQAKYDNAIDAIKGINTDKPHIVFLDINMPEMTGIEFLESISHLRLNTIMTTAYPNYALSGFEYNVVDYLLKPISFTRFMKAINKVMEKLQPETSPGLVPVHDVPLPVAEMASAENLPREMVAGRRFFMVKEDKKLVKVNLDEIIFVEGMKDYVKIHLPNRFLVTHITMTKIADLLTPPQFIRINRSFIVQTAFIKLIEGNMIETIYGHKLSIGINYRDQVKGAIQQWLI